VEKEPFLQYELLKTYPELRHLVSGKVAGMPLNFSLALHTGEPAEEVKRNRERLREFFGLDSRFVGVTQIHGNRVHRVEKLPAIAWEEYETRVQADALVTDLPGVVLNILTADCVPLLLYDPLRRVIAAVHAGWKGTAQAIAARTVEEMNGRYGCDPGSIVAAIGPAIGGCCYEVGEEVASAFEKYPKALRRGGKSPYLDLKEVNRVQLLGAGLSAEKIEVSPLCTACERASYFSYRAENGCSGRFVSAIMINPNAS